MTAKTLKGLIEGLTQDIDFIYKEKLGSICPFSIDDISLTYDGKTYDASSIDEAMGCPFIDGKCLNEVASELDI